MELTGSPRKEPAQLESHLGVATSYPELAGERLAPTSTRLMPLAFFKETWSRVVDRFLRPSAAGVASASEFDRAFQVERARCDRSGKVFSLVAFVPAEGTQLDHLRLLRVLRNRVRLTDVIGHLDAQRIGVLMPETVSRGAWTFADEILERAAALQLAYDCEVFTYPADWPAEKSGGSDEGARRAIGDGIDQHSRFKSVSSETAGQAATKAVRKSQPEGLGLVRDGAGDRPVADMLNLFYRPVPVWKRTMDIVVSAVLLLLLLPLIALVSLAIRLDSPGPIVFRQKRAGVGGKPFTFYKFRSMYIDAEARRKALEEQNEATGPVFKMRNDPRITPVGRLLRRLSIDEIPQLWNVLRGDMTLVGPRPPILDEVHRYEPWQRQRLDTKGGLTCIWQVSGRSNVPFVDWMRMDLRYIAKRSLFFDLSLLAKTAGAILTRRGAY